MESVFYFFSSRLSAEWAVFLTAMLPFIELRGAVPLGISLGIAPLKVFFLAVCGNIIPIVPLLFLLDPVREFLIKRSKIMHKFFEWLYNRTIRKSSNVEKYGALGLILFTAVPFPTTGAWTASLAAVIFKIKFSYSFFSISTGVLAAGIAVTLMSLAVI